MIDLAEGTREVIEVSPEGAPEIIEVSSSRAGRAATVAIGVITTGAPGTSASVTNSGTAGEAVLDFTIPTGENVELRINGGYLQWKTTEAETWNNLIEIADITATIDIGTVTTGDPNTDVLVTNSGAGKDAVFNFTIPRGDSVELRINGGYIQWKTTTATTWNNLHAVSAITPTITVGTVTTGNAGTNVAVTNSGTGKDGIFNFTIPRGDDVQLRIDSGYLQWKNTTASTWTNIVQITDITATIEVGTVTTGAAGTSVTFVNAGSGKDAIFNLSIPKGTTFTPSVSAEGVISFTNDGGLANPSSVDITGPQGIQGEIGPQGPQGVGVPTINTGDAGKFLKVNTTETDTEWTALPEATDTVKGAVELATPAEVLAGTDNERAVTVKDLDYSYATIDSDRIYDGVNLETKFAAEIAEYSDVWAWIKARITAVDFSGLHVGDYVPFAVGADTVQAQIAGIDTYYRTGDVEIGHHIDWVSRDCLLTPRQWNTTNINNGNASNPCPYMVSGLKAWLDGLVTSLPVGLQAVIVHKRILLESRYTSGSTLTDSTSWAWNDIGKLWVPSEFEVYGSIVWGTKGYSQNGGVQYPIFANSWKSRQKGAGHNGNRSNWWLASVFSGNSTSCCYVNNGGNPNGSSASYALGVPLCFRIA